MFTIDKGTAEIDLACLKQPVKDVKVIYPSTGDCTFEMEGTKLKVTFPAKAARTPMRRSCIMTPPTRWTSAT